MSRVLVFILVAAALIIAPFATHADYGSESITYSGPNPLVYHGCAPFETRIPVEMAGLDPTLTYRLRTQVRANYLDMGGDIFHYHALSVVQQPGSSNFTFWIVLFDDMDYTWPPGTTQHYPFTRVPFPVIPESDPRVTDTTIMIELFDNTETVLTRLYIRNYDCATGTFIGPFD